MNGHEECIMNETGKPKKAKKDFWQAIQEMRADSNFQPVDFSDEEIDSWRSKSTGRKFSWD
jgi:hypothetical protein